MTALRQALLVPSGNTGHHLFFVITDPQVIGGYGNAPQVVMVCICTVDESLPYDEACVLQPGQHPFIQHPSYLAYRHMRVDSASHVDRMIATNVWIPQTDCTVAVLQQIRAGVCASRLTRREFKQLFNCPP